jgi:hypothetical protein
MALKHGIPAQLTTLSKLTEVEQHLADSGFEPLAWAAREARLDHPTVARAIAPGQIRGQLSAALPGLTSAGASGCGAPLEEAAILGARLLLLARSILSAGCQRRRTTVTLLHDKPPRSFPPL